MRVEVSGKPILFHLLEAISLQNAPQVLAQKAGAT
jgi:hypothetical protein